MASDTVRARVLVSGRVQGVYFRQSTAVEAKAAGVAGWVRNLADGNVEAVFEGSGAAVETMLDYVAAGPAHANVDSVTVAWEQPEGDLSFSIR